MVPNPSSSDSARKRLVFVKVIHTLAWAFFASCIIGIPIAAWLGHHAAAGLLAAIVFMEVAILATNEWACPLTAVAARYTDDRASNFDIYLPVWLARYNKQVFGPLYVLSVAYAAWNWVVS